MKKWIFILIGAAIVIYFGSRILIDVVSHRPKNLGVEQGQLAPCPESPNCISSQASETDSEHYMAPLELKRDVESAKKQMIEAIESMRGSKIIDDKGNYIYAEYTTPVMHFVDDVEVYIDEDENLIHFRSASRLGHSDLGENRERMEQLAKTYQALN